jgi:hypothetical protein
MRPIIITLLVAFAAGCGGGQKTDEEARAEVFEKAESASGPSAARDVEQLEAWSGQNITLVGTFDHLNFQHGIIRLPSGLKVYLPHFDKFMEGDDWFKYIGKRCWAKGRLHTYTKDIDGFRGPSLELNDFSGP